MVDLDRYAEPSRTPEVLAARRAALLDQLGWLTDEAAALVPLLAALPAWAVDQSPTPDQPTAKEVFAGLAALDRDVYPGWLHQLEPDTLPELAIPSPLPGTEGANDRDLDHLLAGIQAARTDLVALIASVEVDGWGRKAQFNGTETDLYGLALAIVQHDADRLKDLAYRLHEADLRPPKA
ncbi:MAG: DinB family protein [Bacteroidota bacterium]